MLDWLKNGGTALKMEFAAAARDLARNPLGIIALFIVLVYAMASLVFGISAGQLQSSERQPLIWFLVVFPVLVLLSFVDLVINHHAKLYAPKDFQEAEGFFRALGSGEMRERLEEEVREIQQQEASDSRNEYSAVPKSDSIRDTYILAEELALRELQAEYDTPIQRQVGVGGRDVGFDGAFVKGGVIHLVEVKFTRHHSLKYVAASAARQFSWIATNSKVPLKFVLAIVAAGVKDETWNDRKNRAEAIIAKTGLKVELKVFKFSELQGKYGLGE